MISHSLFADSSNKQTSVLVTGGCGYIGSHTVLQLLEQDYNVVIVDNLSNSRPDTIDRMETFTGKKIYFHNTDITNQKDTEKVFAEYLHDASPIPPISVVIHFAAFKAVNESNSIPLKYYHNNVFGTITLVETMKKFGVKRLIFSSSAVVYGIPTAENRAYIGEEFVGLTLTNPYGRTKKMCEEILQDLTKAEPGWKIILLRYFNPVGAHPDAIVGEDPVGIPNNLMPFVARVAMSNLLEFKEGDVLSPRLSEIKAMKHLNVFGSDYDTKDKSGVRDFIHVVDLAQGHMASLKAVLKQVASNGPWWDSSEIHVDESSICRVYNLGCGRGYSVFDVVNTFSRVNKVEIPYKLAPRREGDVPHLVANPSRAKKELGFETKRSLAEMCSDMWKWQKKITIEADEPNSDTDPNENPLTAEIQI